MKMSSLIADCFSSFYSVDTIFWTVKMTHIQNTVFSRAVLGVLYSLVFGGFSRPGKVRLVRFSVVAFRQPRSNLPALAFLPIR